MDNQPDREPIGSQKNLLPLSIREREIAQLLASGLRLAQIAAKLQITVRTVSTYRARVLRKLNLKTNTQLMAYLYQLYLPESPPTVNDDYRPPDTGDAQESR